MMNAMPEKTETAMNVPATKSLLEYHHQEGEAE
jgi:hypothetical protein